MFLSISAIDDLSDLGSRLVVRADQQQSTPASFPESRLVSATAVWRVHTS